MAGNDEDLGLFGAHTPGDFPGAGAASPSSAAPALEIDPERARKIGTVKATAEAAMAGLAAKLGEDEPDEADQPSLLFDPDEPQALFSGPVRHVAELRSAAKRGRGRPQGSQNRRSDDLRNYLLSMGYRDPALNLADLANADPLALALEMTGLAAVVAEGASPLDVLNEAARKGMIERDKVASIVAKAHDLVKSANSELMPYFHAKRPQEIQVNKQVLGVMIVGDMPSAPPEEGGFLDLTSAPAPK